MRWLRLAFVGLTAIPVLLLFQLSLVRRPHSTPDQVRAEFLGQPIERLKATAEILAVPSASGWQGTFRESGQTVAQFQRSRARRATPAMRTLIFRQLGSMTPGQLERSARWAAVFFQCPVQITNAVVDPTLSLSQDAQRIHPGTGQLQWHSQVLLKEHLLPARPTHAYAIVALTATDLFPDPNWNFVFGQATGEGAAVLSVARLGEGTELQRRTFRIVAHETGHVFGLPHCVAYRCLMNGSISLEESDRSPLDPCPSCLAKLAWATGFDPERHAAECASFLIQQGFPADAARFDAMGRGLRTED